MEWLTGFLEKLLQFIPRLLIIRATHGGIKWVRGKHVKPLRPGIHIYWPLMTDVEVLVTARQTLNIQPQVLTTSDGVTVAVSSVAVYRICNIAKAIGKRNWDIDEVVQDVAQTTVVGVISTSTMQDLSSIFEINDRLTVACTESLREFGVQIYSVGLTDLARCRVLRLFGLTTNPGEPR